MTQTKNRSLQVAAIMAITVLAFGTFQFASAEVKLEAQLELAIDVNDGSGKAKYEERGDRIKASVEIEDMEADTTYTILVNGETVGVITTDALGFGDVNLDSRNGADEFALANAIKENLDSNSDNLVEISLDGIVVLSGNLQ